MKLHIERAHCVPENFDPEKWQLTQYQLTLTGKKVVWAPSKKTKWLIKKREIVIRIFYKQCFMPEENRVTYLRY